MLRDGRAVAASMLLILVFVVGYLAIVFEHRLAINKAGSALLTGVLCWTLRVTSADPETTVESLTHQLGDVSGILFFLLGAMTIVELVDAHDGFEILTARIRSTSRRRLLVIVATLAFFLSAVLDNLTTSIVMMSLVRKLMRDDDDRMMFGGVIIVAANAGGVWSPIGDVTTTMLWIGGQVTAGKLVRDLLLPAIVSVVVPVAIIAWRMRGEVAREPQPDAAGLHAWLDEVTAARAESSSEVVSVTLPARARGVGKSLAELDLRVRSGFVVRALARDGEASRAPAAREPLRAGDVLQLEGPPEGLASALSVLYANASRKPTTAIERAVVLGAGVVVLLFVPLFKYLTHLPPFMGILLGVGVLWTLTEVIHRSKTDEDRGTLTVAAVLRRVDTQSVFFFLGILLAIGALQDAGILRGLAVFLARHIDNVDAITIVIGLTSSVVDNVPLVAAAQGMYPLASFPTDHAFWHFLAFCAGTGGSILIIGSAAGIAVMGIQRITFGWYVRRVSLPALLGYIAGAAAHLAAAG